MADQKDDNLIMLITLGAWIRGTDAASSFIENNYSPEGARLLRQPAIVDYLISQIDKLPANLRSDLLISQIRTGLDGVRKIMGTQIDTPIPQQSVKDLHNTVTSLVKDINGGIKGT